MARSGSLDLVACNTGRAGEANRSGRANRFFVALWSCLLLTLWSAVLATAVFGGHEAQARRQDSGYQVRGEATVALSGLPAQAQEVHRRILSGGPFRYDKDGIVFGNRERLLPRQPRGFYHEYTVPTPGERDRGARRIVCGGKDTRQPETCFYTEDHYQSFHPIDPRR
jgi:ribonuclease T1